MDIRRESKEQMHQESLLFELDRFWQAMRASHLRLLMQSRGHFSVGRGGLRAQPKEDK
jgi:hypothetical protein